MDTTLLCMCGSALALSGTVYCTVCRPRAQGSNTEYSRLMIPPPTPAILTLPTELLLYILECADDTFSYSTLLLTCKTLGSLPYPQHTERMMHKFVHRVVIAGHLVRSTGQPMEVYVADVLDNGVIHGNIRRWKLEVPVKRWYQPEIITCYRLSYSLTMRAGVQHGPCTEYSRFAISRYCMKAGVKDGAATLLYNTTGQTVHEWWQDGVKTSSRTIMRKPINLLLFPEGTSAKCSVQTTTTIRGIRIRCTYYPNGTLAEMGELDCLDRPVGRWKGWMPDGGKRCTVWNDSEGKIHGVQRVLHSLSYWIHGRRVGKGRFEAEYVKQ